jgi:diguanylate cyclase (GGDEF)-like protein
MHTPGSAWPAVETGVVQGHSGSVGRRLGGLIVRFEEKTSTNTRIVLFTALLGAAAAILSVPLVPTDPPIRAPFDVPWWALAMVFYAAEAFVVHLHIGRSAHSLSMSEVPVVIGLLTLSPTVFILVRVGGSVLALLISRRQKPVKIAFNAAQWAFCSVLSVAIVHLAATSSGELGPTLWIAVFAAALLENLVSLLFILTVISLAEGTPQYRRLPEMLRVGTMVTATNTSLALMALTVIWVRPGAAWLFVIPILTAALAYRAYISERKQHEALEMLHESTMILQRSPHLDAALISLLDHSRKMFRATVAEICLLPRREGEEILRARVGPGDAVSIMEPIGPVLVDPLLLRAVSERQTFLVHGSESAPEDPARWHWRNALIAPLCGESTLVGTLLIADRMSDISTFDHEDLKLFETLANHTAVALENGQLEQSLVQLSQLKEELHQQAFHDALTGLANRSLFAQTVAQRLESAGPAGMVPVVLFLDLDDFKFVNDSLGHAAGDALLVTVGDRIKSSLRASDVAARLGGDEFGVLLWDDPDMLASMRVANRLTASFEPGIQLRNREVVVRASIGVAAGHPGLDTAGELLRNADVAMYSAKARGKGRVVVFEPSMHEAVVARAQLSADLERAAAAGELVLQYQPIVDLGTGRMIGAEALVRWAHPERGRLGPDEFIKVAEESQSILEIGRWVLSEACLQAREWQRLAPDGRLPVSVNISARQLAQPNFVEEVLGIISRSGVPPEALVLEMTETAMLHDSAATHRKLIELREAGIGISVDDFGTGYSSLSYLQRFPVSSLKIARDFVDIEGVAPEAWELAHAIIALGRALRLTVIAEGVERRSQLARLQSLGCEYAQGFFLARPLDHSGIEALLAGGGTLLGRVDAPGAAATEAAASVAGGRDIEAPAPG